LNLFSTKIEKALEISRAFIFRLSRTWREKLKHEGHQVHKGGNKARFYGLFSFVTFVYFVFRKVFPLKTVEPIFRFRTSHFDILGAHDGSQVSRPVPLVSP
jgi:hypothetical protein